MKSKHRILKDELLHSRQGTPKARGEWERRDYLRRWRRVSEMWGDSLWRQARLICCPTRALPRVRCQAGYLLMLDLDAAEKQKSTNGSDCRVVQYAGNANKSSSVVD